MADEFIELHGDRLLRRRPAIVAGLAEISGRSASVVIGFQKGQDTEENIRRNFGLPHPEGYRKAMRMMELAERFAMPVLTFVDVQGAFPGAAAEERGIADGIARSVGMLTGCGRRRGRHHRRGRVGRSARAGRRRYVVALENSIYSVISPEGCAAILWRSGEQSHQAAYAMKVTANEQKDLGIIDIVIPEPGEGAHTDPAEMARRIKEVVLEQFDDSRPLTLDELVEARYKPSSEPMGPYTVADSPRRRSARHRRVASRPAFQKAVMPQFPGTRRAAPANREEV
jgi:acetyl-CoA carboxylase carboxyl transferase subunit alpha